MLDLGSARIALDSDFEKRRATSRIRIHIVKLLAAAAWSSLIFAIFCVNFGPSNTKLSVGRLLDLATDKIQYHNPWALNKDDFADKWAAVEYGGEFDGAALFKLCNHTDWREDVVFRLQHAYGGLANLRAITLDFIYFSVNARVPIILPEYIERDPDDVKDIMRDGVPNAHFDHFFDKQHFLAKMSEFCPQMPIYESLSLAPYNNTLNETFFPNATRRHRWRKHNLKANIDEFDSWLEEQEDYSEYDVSLVNVERTYFHYDLEPLERQRRTFGALLQMRPDIRRLAGKAVWKLGQLAPKVPVDPADQIHHKLYMGAHLRTENDAVVWFNGGDTGLQRQTRLYLELARRRSADIIYVASGKPSDVRKLAHNATREGIAVVCKEDLLDPEDLAAVHALGFDQQAELDYEILSRADFFVGPGVSSFTWNIAVRRYYYNFDDPSVKRGSPLAAQEFTATAIWDDGLSRIVERGRTYGPFEMEFYGPHFTFP